ncbi:putative heat repeat protein [Phaeomoniella chlamydospora]|uniref:Putative heat repeat protein n=1 Tax=Phaeomoniella chlamydospora TaxID=158046 RepID=A0A0G2GCU4_PHACM|nr:putative heat repeat protein [Phaeomoniella chlamydospora]
MDIKAFELLKLFQCAQDSAVDTKLRYLNDLKSDIKHKSVPDTAIANTFEVIRRSIASSQSQQLMTLGFSTLSNFLKRLNVQGQTNVIGFHGHKLYYALLIEKLSDHRETIRVSASKAFADFWVYVHPEARFEIEHNIIQNVLSAKNPKPKVLSLQWLSDMVKEHGLKFRSYVPLLIVCLEDADGAVRDTAKATVIQLFKNTSGRALSDLSKQLRLCNVRKTIAEAILAEVSGTAQHQADLSTSVVSQSPAPAVEASLPARPHTRAELQRPTSVMSNRGSSRTDAQKTGSNATPRSQTTSVSTPQHDVSSLHIPKRSNRAAHHSHTQSDPSELGADVVLPSDENSQPEIGRPVIKINNDNIAPLWVDSKQHLDEWMMSGRSYFAGKESEQNWSKREESINILRRVTKGNGPTDERLAYCGNMYVLVECILKAINSLRTTLSSSGCDLIQEMCAAVSHGIDCMADLLLYDLVKLCAATKTIARNKANDTVDAIVGSASMNKLIVNHVWQAAQDKNVQPRRFAAGWLKTLMQAHRQGCNKSGCLDLIDKSIRKGLEDANLDVRKDMRVTYWTFAQLFPDRAQSIMSSLDTKSQNALQQDKSNPRIQPAALGSSASTQPHNATSRRTKQSLKDAIASQKKLQQQPVADDIPSRPASAMSVITEVKGPSKSAVRPLPTSATTAPTAPTVHSIAQPGTLFSAPMRPPMRPATSRKPDPARTNVLESQSKGSPPHTESATITATVPRMAAQPERSGHKSSGATPKAATNERPAHSTVTNSSRAIPKASTAMKPPMSPPKPKVTSMPTPVGSPARPKSSSQRPISSASNATTGMTVLDADNADSQFPQALDSVSTPTTAQPTPDASKDFDPMSIPTASQPRSNSPQDLEPMETPTTSQPRRTSQSLSGIPRPVKQHSRQSSDDLAPPAETIRVYEDPHVSKDTVNAHGADRTMSRTMAAPPSNVLGALPINSRNDQSVKMGTLVLPEGYVLESPLHGQGRPDPRDKSQSQRRWHKAEVARPDVVHPRSKERAVNQEHLRRYIEGIRNKSIDIMGFRKLQGIIQDHDKIFDDEVLFDDMVLALLDLLELPNKGPRQFLGRVHDQKESALATIKLIFDQQPKYIKAYYARALTALIGGRQHFDSASHIVSGFEALANRILRECNPSETIDAVIDLLIVLENNEITDRSMIMGIGMLDALLCKMNGTIVTAEYEHRLTEVARNGFSRPRPGIRRAMVTYARTLGLYIKPETRFLSLVAGGDADLRSLLTYYMNIKE